MSNYTPPDNDNADFEIESYSPASNDSADFQFTTAQILEAPPLSVSVSARGGSTTGEGAATLSAPANTITVSGVAGSASGAGEVTLSAPTLPLTLTALAGTTDPTGEATLNAPTLPLTVSPLAGVLGFTEWAIDGDLFEEVQTETTTFDTLTLTARVQSDTLQSIVRPLKNDQGQLTIRATDDGGFTAIDRAGGGNTYTIQPPVQRVPLRQTRDRLVADYEESLVANSTDQWDVTLELVGNEERTDTKTIAETAGANEWALETPNGTIATRRVSVDLLGRGDGGVRRFELTTRLTFEQAHAFETAFAKGNGTDIRDLADATNQARDTTGGENTLTVTTPSGIDAIADGDYVVLGWSSRRLSEAYQEIAIEIAEKA